VRPPPTPRSRALLAHGRCQRLEHRRVRPRDCLKPAPETARHPGDQPPPPAKWTGGDGLRTPLFAVRVAASARQPLSQPVNYRSFRLPAANVTPAARSLHRRRRARAIDDEVRHGIAQRHPRGRGQQRRSPSTTLRQPMLELRDAPPVSRRWSWVGRSARADVLEHSAHGEPRLWSPAREEPVAGVALRLTGREGVIGPRHRLPRVGRTADEGRRPPLRSSRVAGRCPSISHEATRSNHPPRGLHAPSRPALDLWPQKSKTAEKWVGDEAEGSG
jgi:hypothetical protein